MKQNRIVKQAADRSGAASVVARGWSGGPSESAYDVLDLDLVEEKRQEYGA